MSDIKYTFKSGTLIPDIELDGADLASGYDLETAIIISLFSNRRAEEDDRVEGNDRMGYWGDTYNDPESHKTGSRLWLLERETDSQTVLNKARYYINESLAWLTEDGVADRVETTTSWMQKGIMLADIKVYKPEGVFNFRYEHVWTQLIR